MSGGGMSAAKSDHRSAWKSQADAGTRRHGLAVDICRLRECARERIMADPEWQRAWHIHGEQLSGIEVERCRQIQPQARIQGIGREDKPVIIGQDTREQWIIEVLGKEFAETRRLIRRYRPERKRHDISPPRRKNDMELKKSGIKERHTCLDNRLGAPLSTRGCLYMLGLTISSIMNIGISLRVRSSSAWRGPFWLLLCEIHSSRRPTTRPDLFNALKYT